jgi:hypothetical protein
VRKSLKNIKYILTLYLMMIQLLLGWQTFFKKLFMHCILRWTKWVLFLSWSHLDGLNWEVLIINESYIETYTHAGGKIVTTAASIRGYTDQQLATLLAHEVCSVFFNLLLLLSLIISTFEKKNLFLNMPLYKFHATFRAGPVWLGFCF